MDVRIGNVTIRHGAHNSLHIQVHNTFDHLVDQAITVTEATAVSLNEALKSALRTLRRVDV